MPNKNANALPEGTILKHGKTEYRIERFLGDGGFGITYLVSGLIKISGNTVLTKFCIKEHFLSTDCERDHRTLAVTYSHPAKQRVDESKKDFISEAKRLRDKIQHSNIVRVKDVFEANDTAYYVMEFLDGKSMRHYIREHGACREEEATALMLPIIRAIGYLHDNHITHLDIKPDNIMIIENGRGSVSPILIDFGLSKHYNKKGEATSTVRIMATSDGYSPIEQYQGIETFSPTADIYALAATYLYCITGKNPKRSADIRPGEIEHLLKGIISESSANALLKAMKPSQYERTQSVKDFMSELCPNERAGNWDIETDNNITDPLFFRKKNSASFVTKLKSFFSKKKRQKIKLLDIPFDKDSKCVVTESIYVPSRLLAYQNGLLYSIEQEQWNIITKEEKETFYPFIIELFLDGQRISIFVEEKKNIAKNEIESALEYYRNLLNPTGLDGYENGECRLLTFQEMTLIDSDYRIKIQNTFESWGLKYMSFPQWFKDENGGPSSFPLVTGPAKFTSNLRPFVTYYATYIPYKVSQRNQDFSIDGVKLIHFEERNNFPVLVSLYYNQYRSSLLKLPLSLAETSYQDYSRVSDVLLKSGVSHFPADDETPREWFHENIMTKGGFLLASDPLQFISALKIQAQINKSNPETPFRIINPIVLHSLWDIVTNKQSDYENFSSYMEGNTCKYEFSDGVCSINYISKSNDISQPFDEESVIKGASIQKMILNQSLKNLLVMDIMEYEVAFAMERGGKIRDYITLLPANTYHFPCRKDKRITYDALQGSNLYLHIGGKRINKPLNPYLGNVKGEGYITVSVEIDSNKMVALSFKNKGMDVKVILGDHLAT